MNAKEALERISTLLNLNFKAEKFYTTKLKDGMTEITNNKTEDFMIGDEVYMVGESTLAPVLEGDYITREGMIIKTDSMGKIVSMAAEMEDENDATAEIEVEIGDEKEDMMSAAELTDGTKIETDETGDFKVGQKLYVITEAGDKVSAPEGEHTTKSGVVVVVDGEGFITGVKYPDKDGEGSLSEMKKMKEAMAEMIGLIKDLNDFRADFNKMKTDFETFKKQPDREPVVKKFSTTSADRLDWKLELIKSSRGLKK
jgi:hypothetical protein